MTILIANVWQTDPNTAATSTALSISPSAGSTLAVVSAVNFATVTGVSSANSGALTQKQVKGTNQLLYGHILQNCAGGSDTITASISSSQSIRPLCVIEISGVGATPYDISAGQDQATPTTGTDATTSTNGTSTGQPALVVGFCARVFNNSLTPKVGTGFTDGGAVWGGSFGAARVESKRVTATGAQAATFTARDNAHHMTLMFVFDEQASSGIIQLVKGGLAGGFAELPGGFRS